MNIPEETLNWWNSLTREEQIEAHASLVDLMKPKYFYIRCKPTIPEVSRMVLALDKLKIVAVPENQEGKLLWRFNSQDDRNTVDHYLTFSK